MGPVIQKPDYIGAIENMERENLPEYCLSPKNKITLPVDSIHVVSQVRHGRNAIQEDLNSSVNNRYVMHDIQVAIMSEDEFKEYIEIVNELWGSKHDISDFEPYDNNLYNVVIAGHGRLSAAKRYDDRHPEIRSTLDCTYYLHPSYEEVMAVQLEENLHSVPSTERQAKAIVEIYLIGLKQGLWTGPQEFLRRPEVQLSGNQLRNALYYAELPEDIQEYVQAGTLPYTVAVELGRSKKSVQGFYTHKFMPNSNGNGTKPKPLPEIEDLVRGWFLERIVIIQNNSLNSPDAVAHIQASVKDLELMLDSEPGNLSFGDIEGVMSSPEEQAQDYAKEQRRKYTSLVKQLGEKRIFGVHRALLLHAQNVENGNEVITKFGQRMEQISKQIGSTTLNEA